jgi:hypothetical protein
VATSYNEELSEPPVLVSLRFPRNRLHDVDSYMQRDLDNSMQAAANWGNRDGFVEGVIPFLHQIARARFNADNPNANKDVSRSDPDRI